MNADTQIRKNKIFDIIVRSYIETAEPVGSRTISKLSGIGLSSASIRNVMADLEDVGFLAQPHTSAGRVPTDKGYRYWVDELMEPEELSAKEKGFVKTELSKARTIEGLAERTSKIISTLTENAALTYIKNLRKISFLSYLLEELIEAEKLNDFFEEEAELFIDGAARVFEQPEFQDLKRMGQLLRALEEKNDFLDIFVKDLAEEGIHVHIGSEMNDLDNVSLVVKDCYIGSTPIGTVAVLGPTRMHYPKVVSVVEFVSKSVNDVMRKF